MTRAEAELTNGEDQPVAFASRRRSIVPRGEFARFNASLLIVTLAGALSVGAWVDHRHALPLPAGMYQAKPDISSPDDTLADLPRQTVTLPADSAFSGKLEEDKHQGYAVGIRLSDAQAMQREGCSIPIVSLDGFGYTDLARFFNEDGWRDFSVVTVDGEQYEAIGKTADPNANKVAIGCTGHEAGDPQEYAQTFLLTPHAVAFSGLQQLGVTGIM